MKRPRRCINMHRRAFCCLPVQLHDGMVVFSTMPSYIRAVQRSATVPWKPLRRLPRYSPSQSDISRVDCPELLRAGIPVVRAMKRRCRGFYMRFEPHSVSGNWGHRRVPAFIRDYGRAFPGRGVREYGIGHAIVRLRRLRLWNVWTTRIVSA